MKAKHLLIVGLSVVGLFVSLVQAEGQGNPSSQKSSRREQLLKWAFAGPPESFHLGMYLAGNGTKVPLEKMFRDFAEAGVDIIWMNQRCFGEFHSKGLLEYARTDNVRIVLHCFIGMDKGDIPVNTKDKLVLNEEGLRKRIRDIKQSLDKDKNGEMVIGYATNDEIEWTLKGVPNVDKIFQRYSDIIREEDPDRLVQLNHSPRNENTGQYNWHHSGEDWPWCSVGVIAPGNRSLLTVVKGLAKENGFSNFIGVGQINAGGLQGLVRIIKDSAMTWTDFPADVSRDDYADYTMAEQIDDTMMNCYLGGIGGLVYYIYNEGPGEESFVNIDGLDLNGRWSAFLAAAKKIRRLQRWPEITVLNQSGNKLVANATGKWGGHRVRWMEIQKSDNQGKQWSSLPKIQGRSGSIPLPEKYKGAVRVRAWDGHHYSLWKFWDVYEN